MIRIRRLAKVLPICLALSFQLPALSMMLDYTPLSALDRNSTVALRHLLHDSDFRDNKTDLVEDVSFDVNDDSELVMSGKDLSGKPWKVVKRFYGFGTEVYGGDLDGNGRQDLIIWQVNGGCGLAPTAVLTTVFFDDEKRPHFFELFNYGDLEKKDCVSDLIRISGKSVLVVDSIAYHSAGSKEYSYWQTCLYEARDCGFQFLPFYHGKKTPLLVRFRFKNNHEIVKNPPADALAHRDLSATASTCEVRIKSLKLEDGYFRAADFSNGIVPGEKEPAPLFTAWVSCETKDETVIAAIDTKVAAQILNIACVHKLPVKIPAKDRRLMPLRIQVFM